VTKTAGDPHASTGTSAPLAPVTGQATFFTPGPSRIDPAELARWQAAFRPAGTIQPAAPAGATEILLDGHSYSYALGVFWQRHAAGWIVVAAPAGAKLPGKPVGSTMVFVDRMPFYTYHGMFYVWNSAQKSYVVVHAPTL
jgi:hypothetical protein